LVDVVSLTSLTITQNATLSTFTGLDAFENITDDFTVSKNPSLPLSTVQEFTNSIVIGGNVNIN